MATTLENLVVQLVRLFDFLEPQLANQRGRVDLLASLGWSLPPGFTDVDMGGIALQDVFTKFEALRALTDAERQDELLVAQRVAELAEAVAQAATSLDAAFRGLPGDYLSVTQIQTRFPRRLLDRLVIRLIERELHLLHQALSLAGVFVVTLEPELPAQFQPAHTRYHIQFEALTAILGGGTRWSQVAYGWGTAEFDVHRLVFNLAAFFNALGQRTISGRLSRAMEEALTGSPAPDADTNPLPLASSGLFSAFNGGLDMGVSVFGLRRSAPTSTDGGVGASPFLFGEGELTVPLSLSDDQWDLQLLAQAVQVSGGLMLLLRAGQPAVLRSNFFEPDPGPALTGRLGLRLRFISAAPAGVALLSLPGGIGLQIGEASLAAGIQMTDAAPEPFGELAVRAGRLSVAPGEDGFLSKLLGTTQLALDFDLLISYTPSGGLRFQGSGGLETAIAVGAQIGPVTVQSVVLRADADGQQAEFEGSVRATGELGPVAVTVERLGLLAELDFQKGNLGPADLDLAFKPPNGLGLSVQAGPISGGGFISFDNGRYAGALELRIYEITVKAFGVIDTKMPDGRRGFSFVIVISAEFQPIQLGLGFTLNGVGGILGINRTLSEEALDKALASGQVDDILFPRRLEQRAPQIIEALANLFPPVEDKQVFGPMAKLGWGTPSLIRGDLALVLALPEKVLTILGLVRVELPRKTDPNKPALVDLALTVKGVLDFPQQLFALESHLREGSTVGGFDVSGDMALQLRWGSRPNFLVSFGGFHSGYTPPDDFPALQRLSVDLGINGNPSVKLSGFLAVTSNSVQVGGGLEVRASGFGIRLNATIAVEAIFVFSPFSFAARIDVDIDITFLGRGFGVDLRGTLSGPSPWHLTGRVCASLWFASACLGVDITFGESQPDELPSLNPWIGSEEERGPGVPQNVIGLEPALRDSRSWTPLPGAGSLGVVSLTEAPTGSAGADVQPPIDPLDTITVRQRVVPLETQAGAPIKRFGPVASRGTPHFRLVSAAILQAPPLPLTRRAGAEVADFFAPGQYFELDEAKALSSPSYTRFTAGYAFDVADQFLFGSIQADQVGYETFIIDSRRSTLRDDLRLVLPDDQLDGMLRIGPVARSGVAQKGAGAFSDPLAPPRFDHRDPGYVVTDRSGGTLTGVLNQPATKVEALLVLESHLEAHPEQRDQLQVTRVEVARAA
jgi:hypothetical protein